MIDSQANKGEVTPSMEQRITVDAIKQMAQILHDAWLGMPFLSLLVIIGLWWQVEHLKLLAWGLCAIAMTIMRYLAVRSYLATTQDFELSMRCAKQLTLIAALDGLIWGGAFILFYTPDSIPEQVLFLTMLVSIVSGSIFMASFWPPAAIAFAIPSFCLATIPFLLQDTPASYVMAIALILMLVILSNMMKAAQVQSRRAISLRFENLDLLENLRIQKQLADNANQAKSKFLAAASHDLRQPIHAQGLFLEVLSRTDQTEYQQKLTYSARAASQASGELLDALLDFSRIEAGVIEPNLQPIRLQALLNKIETELAPQADAKAIAYRSRETHVAVLTDPMLLELILRNLITNAIRYTSQGGLLVACRQRGKHAILEVWDTGIGIAPEHQKVIFSEFHQLGNPERDRKKGLGLGLAIADGLVRVMKHELTLLSRPERGSVFRLTLPVATTAPVEQGVMVQSKTRLLNARVLVIDDDEIVRESMLHLLRDWGCECDAAESIEEAVALTQLNAPDIVISDYRLREQRTGVEAIAAVRTQLGKTIPALLITGDTAPERLREAQASGIPLLHKPVTPGKLYRKLVELQQEIA